jgi:DNA-directed RNA polymerase II subunit RPB2
MMNDWDIINAYFETNINYLSRHQLESFNNFINNTVPYTIKTLNPFILIFKDNHSTTKKELYEVQVFIGGEDGNDIRMEKPYDGTEPILPNIARLKSMTYNILVSVDVLIKFKNLVTSEVTDVVHKNIRIGSIPIMLHTNGCFLFGKDKEELTKLGECPYDQGGYFIIDGKEKVIISQERIAPNKLFLSVPTAGNLDYSLKGECRSVSDDNKLFAKVLYLYTMSKPRNFRNTEGGSENDGAADSEEDNYVESVSSKIDAFGAHHIVVDIMSITLKNIPVFIIFRALGVESDKEIMTHILYDNEMNNEAMVEMVRKMIVDSKKLVRDGEHIYTQVSALNYLKNFTAFKDVDYVKYVLLQDFLPNMNDYKSKAIFFGYLINQMIKATIGIIPVNSRDNYMNKRIDVSGILLSNVFRDFYNKFRNNVIQTIDRSYTMYDKQFASDYNHLSKNLVMAGDLYKIFSPTFIDEGMYKTFKGNWGMLDDPDKTGIVQDLNRLSYLGYVSHVRSVNTPIDRKIKLAAPHRLGSEQFGFMCPFESPDGANIGLLKHMSITCEITSEQDTTELLTILHKNNFKPHHTLQLHEATTNTILFINNNIMGIHNDPVKLYNALRTARRAHELNYQITFFYDVQLNEFRINTDSGRCIRPLFIAGTDDNMKDLKVIKSWYDKDFLGKYIEYVDVNESNYLLIAMNKADITSRHTHCEIHPSLSLSYYTNTIPFLNHNQAPRIVFSGQQGKQAIGVYATNYNSRIDTASYILHYPQKSLVSTKLSKYVFKDQLPNGENLIVAIATYTGYNQEDSIIINKDSIDRGLFNVSYFKTIIEKEYLSENKRHRFVFANPEELRKRGVDVNTRFENYKNIDENGIPFKNAHMNQGDAMIGKVEEIDQVSEDKTKIFNESLNSTKYTDKTIATKKTNYGKIDVAYIYEKNNENNLKIRMRKMRRPILGDKLASMHGQKGVVGMILPQVEMPFTKDGLVPDIIINPHAIPSRMTIGHLIECIMNRLSCETGSEIDATAYDNHNVDEYLNQLEKQGINRYSNEIMYNARTGEQMKTDIFIGPTYYYRLKHMVADKINYRDDSGPIENVTKQPTQGRSNDGGLRIGEMETNALVAHGISSFVKESLMERADGVVKTNRKDKQSHYIYVDENGNDIIYNKDLKYFVGYDGVDIKENTALKVPYSFKLLKQECQSMSIKMNLLTSEIKEDAEGDYDDVYVDDVDDDDVDNDVDED